MQQDNRYDNFPVKIISFRVTVFMLTLISSAILLSKINLWIMAGYMTFVLATYLTIMATACKNCYYYGKRCDMGFSIITTKLFKSGKTNLEHFKKCATKSLIPMLLVMLFPIGAAIINMVQTEKSSILIWTLPYLICGATLLISTPLLACSHCKMHKHCPGNILQK